MGRGNPKIYLLFHKNADGRLYVNEWYEYDKYDNYGHGFGIITEMKERRLLV